MKPADIRAFRERYHFTQRELGEAIDMSRDVVKDLETSRLPITIDRARAFKAFFSFVTKCAETGRL
jgi:DNA-binding XRE family transcriptional regulator